MIRFGPNKRSQQVARIHKNLVWLKKLKVCILQSRQNGYFENVQIQDLDKILFFFGLYRDRRVENQQETKWEREGEEIGKGTQTGTELKCNQATCRSAAHEAISSDKC